MVFYHSFFTMADIFNLSIGTTLIDFFSPAEPFFAGLFILISGVACQLSSSNLKRGIKLFAVAMLITVITFLLGNLGLQVQVVFGILHLLSISMLIVAAINPIIKKINPALGAAICLLIFFATLGISQGFIGFGFLKLALPKTLYTLPFLFPFGIYPKGFFSADYFPLLPWLFLFLCGAFLGVYELKGKFPKFFEKSFCPFLEFIGRRALFIYVVHQPVIAAILFLILSIF